MGSAPSGNTFPQNTSAIESLFILVKSNPNSLESSSLKIAMEGSLTATGDMRVRIVSGKLT